MKLTAKQEQFCLEYLIDLNATQAAIRAGYSVSTARTTGSENMTKPDIINRIAELKADRLEKVTADADYILNRLFAEAEADLGDIYYESGGLKPIHEWPKIWRQGLVAGMEASQSGDKDDTAVIMKVKLADRVRRLELLGKHVGVQAFRENIKVTNEGEVSSADVPKTDWDVLRAAKRAEAKVVH